MTLLRLSQVNSNTFISVKWYMKCFIYWTADSKSSKLWSSQLWTQLRIEAWKSQDFHKSTKRIQQSLWSVSIFFSTTTVLISPQLLVVLYILSYIALWFSGITLSFIGKSLLCKKMVRHFTTNCKVLISFHFVPWNDELFNEKMFDTVVEISYFN